MFIACGINHKTTPIHLRERLAIHDSASTSFLDHLMALPGMNEAVILSTCHRTELYCELSDQKALMGFDRHSDHYPLMHTIARHTQVPVTTLAEHWYAYKERAGIKHALRVASGLDSMLLGEPQIFGQFKQAYTKACDVGTAKSTFKNIFPFIFRASKRIRNESGIDKHALSLASVAAQQILNAFQGSTRLNVLIIGTGDMAQLMMKYLAKANIQHFWIASRTEAHAEDLASQYQATSLNITTLPQFLPQMDVIITATACPIPFITKEMVETSLKMRSQQPQFFLDLALPRNINEDIISLPQVTLCNIDDLKSQCELNLSARQNAAALAEQLLDQELSQFIRWSKAEESQRLITDYRSKMQDIANEELALALQQLKQGECESTLLKKLTHRLFNKLTHLPTISLRQAALEGRTDLLALMHSLLSHSASYETID